MDRWIDKGVLRFGSRVFVEGDSIPSDLLPEDRRAYFVAEGKIAVSEDAEEVSALAPAPAPAEEEEAPKKKRGRPRKTATKGKVK